MLLVASAALYAVIALAALASRSVRDLRRAEDGAARTEAAVGSTATT